MKELLFPAINFFIFCGILFYVLRNPARNAMRKRSSDIEKAIEGAKRVHEMANQKLNEIRDKLFQFEKEKELLMWEAKEDIRRFNEKSEKELRMLLERIKLDNQQRVQEELKKSTEELRCIFAKKIIAFAKGLLTEKLSKNEAPFIDAYIGNLQKGKPWQGERQNAMHEPS